MALLGRPWWRGRPAVVAGEKGVSVACELPLPGRPWWAGEGEPELRVVLLLSTLKPVLFVAPWILHRAQASRRGGGIECWSRSICGVEFIFKRSLSPAAYQRRAPPSRWTQGL
jgi:hypothetical protein